MHCLGLVTASHGEILFYSFLAAKILYNLKRPTVKIIYHNVNFPAGIQDKRLNLQGYRFDNVSLKSASCQTASSTLSVRTSKEPELKSLKNN